MAVSHAIAPEVTGARRRRAKAAAPVARPRGGLSLWAIGLLVTLTGCAAAGTGLMLAGHAPSWRSLAVLMLQAAPLLPATLALGFVLTRLARRWSAVPLALWLGLAILAMAVTLIAAPALTHAAITGTSLTLDDADSEASLRASLWHFAGQLYLYAATAARLWWPAGGLVPVVFAGLMWRRLRG